jgi:hypothetical protein
LATLVADAAQGAIKDRTVLKDEFQNGDIPDQNDFADVIDSIISSGGVEDFNLIGMHVTATGQASRQLPGALIGPATDFSQAAGLADEWIGQRGFLALSFESASQTHYGYLQISAAGGPGSTSPYPMFVEYFVYDDEPGVPIVTGFVPEPSALMLVGMAAMVLLFFRRIDPLRV